MEKKTLSVKKTKDFTATGHGSSPEWDMAEWQSISKHQGGVNYETKFKILYSDTGIYCLYHCQDELVKSTIKQDNADLWTEDVVEAFFWPDERWPVYFEYELSPNNFELPIMVPNFNGQFHGWLPWGNQESRKTRHATHIESNFWLAEFFIPFELLKPLQNCPPKSGTTWRANFYRIDHDRGTTLFAWSPIEKGYHEFENFGVIEFE